MRFVVLFCLLSSLACAQLESDPRYVKKRAERYMARLNYDAAIAYLKKASKRLEKDGEIRLLLGECFFSQGRWPEAANSFESGIALDPRLVARVSHFPLALIRCNKLSAAEKEAKILAQKGRNERLRANGQFCQGLVAWHRGLVAEAISFFKEALRHDPTMPKANYRLGVALLKAGKIEESILSLEKAVKLDPIHHAAAHNIAMAYQRLGNKKASRHWRTRHKEILAAATQISQIKRSLEEVPDQIPLIRRLADIYFKHGLFEDAVSPYSACVAAAPTAAQPRFLYASCLFENGDLHGARLQLNQVLSRHQDHKAAKKLLGTIFELVGAKKEGKK